METKSNTRWSGNDDHMQKSVVRKITFRLMPILVLGLFFSYVDRANLGVLFGPLSRDLHLTAANFGLAAGLFYIGYLLFEIPSNMGLVRFGARRWIARIMVSWGLVTVALTLAQGATSLYALRILLGIAEAGFFPGVIYFLTLWYPPSAHARAYSTLQMSICISLSLGSVLTSSLLVLDGNRRPSGLAVGIYSTRYSRGIAWRLHFFLRCQTVQKTPTGCRERIKTIFVSRSPRGMMPRRTVMRVYRAFSKRRGSGCSRSFTSAS